MCERWDVILSPRELTYVPGLSLGYDQRGSNQNRVLKETREATIRVQRGKE